MRSTCPRAARLAWVDEIFVSKKILSSREFDRQIARTWRAVVQHEFQSIRGKRTGPWIRWPFRYYWVLIVGLTSACQPSCSANCTTSFKTAVCYVYS